MDLLFSIFSDSLQILKTIILYHYLFIFLKKPKKIRFIVPFLFLIVSTLIHYTPDTLLGDFVVVFLHYSFLCVLSWSLYDIRICDLFIKNLWGFIQIAMIDSMATTMAKMIFQIFSLHSARLEIIIIHSITLIFMITSGILLKRRNPDGFHNIKNIYFVFFSLYLCVLTVITVFFETLQTNVSAVLQPKHFEIVLILFVLAEFIQIIQSLLLVISRDISKTNEELAIKYLNTQNEHYAYLEQREEQTRKIRHDMKNHLQILNQLHDENNLTEFKNYLDEITQKVDSLAQPIHVNNKIMNAILNQFYSQALQANIGFVVTGSFPTECNINTYDLSTIFSNLLDNALHAQKQVGTGCITIDCRYTESEIMVTIENEYIGELKEENGTFQTTKENPIEHGFGMKNVNECIKKNGGRLRIITRLSHFTCNILLKNKKQN